MQCKTCTLRLLFKQNGPHNVFSTNGRCAHSSVTHGKALQRYQHYQPSNLLLLEMMGPVKGQLKGSKLQTCRLKANRSNFHRVFKLVKSQNIFLRADSKMKKSFCCQGTAFFYRNITTLHASKLKNSGSQIGTYTTLDFTAKGIIRQLHLTFI